MEFYSHIKPDKKLIDHLVEVAELSEKYGGSRFAEIHYILGISHDFGKYTTFFQDRLFEKKDWGCIANHAYISAIFGAYLCKETLEENTAFFPLWVFSSILSHHGDIKEINNKRYLMPLSSEVSSKSKFELEFVHIKRQLQNMHDNLKYIMRDYEKVSLSKYVHLFVTDDNVVPETLKYLKKLAITFEDEPDENAFWIHQHFYSCLIAADKISASRITPVKDLNGPLDLLMQQKETITKEKSHSKLAKMRNDIFSEVQINIRKYSIDGKFFSITAPTGTGKTFTGFFAAKKLQELPGNKQRIVYALPFTSIIDQNYDDIYQLHSIISDFEQNESRYIIKHHHLANMEYTNEEEDYRKDQAELLIENWNSGIIITTFVQLLETMIGVRNRMLKKYHVLTNSIILLDEVQAIPLEYYRLVEYAFKKLTEVFGCIIILMTATKPMIFSNTIDLLDNPEQYFTQLDRTYICPDMNKITVQQFCNQFLDTMDNEKSYLIVANTINQSLAIFKELHKKVASDKLYYLSTNIIPKQRREILAELKEVLAKRKVILVSTQVVEAGVNLDFDEVIRDLAPIDSIIQCAGRCNREGKKEEGKVKVTCMVDSSGKSYASRIYRNVIINITAELLRDKTEIKESQYSTLIEEYYTKICSGKVSMQESDDLIKAICNMNFDKETGVGQFSLVDSRSNYVDLFIEYDDEASNLLCQLEEAMKISDEKIRRELVKSIRKDMLQYTISIPDKYAPRYNLREIGKTGLLVLDRGNLPFNYDIEAKTGLKRDEEFDMMCF